MATASLTAIITCSIVYVLVGNMGYCLFGNNLEGNFLLAFNRGIVNDGLYLLLNISFLISVSFSFPVIFFGARNNFIAITNNVVAYINKKRVNYRQLDKTSRKAQSKILFVVFTILVFAVIISIAASLNEVEDVFNICGAIAANGTCFIFPCMFYVMLIRKRNKPKKLKYWMALAGFIFFIPFGVFAVVSMFISEKPDHWYFFVYILLMLNKTNTILYSICEMHHVCIFTKQSNIFYHRTTEDIQIGLF